MNFLITGLNQKYYDPYGISWIASLKELAKTTVKPVVIDLGLNRDCQDFLRKHGAMLISKNLCGNIRNIILDSICEISKEVSGKYVYYDADCYFQQNIDNVFDLIDDKIIFTKNKNCGFIAGNSKTWDKLKFVNNMTNVFKDDEKISCFINYFDSNIEFISNKFNCTNTDLKSKNDLLCFHDEVQSVIHPTGSLKKLFLGKKILFEERYKEIFTDYKNEKNKISKRLIFYQKPS